MQQPRVTVYADVAEVRMGELVKIESGNSPRTPRYVRRFVGYVVGKRREEE